MEKKPGRKIVIFFRELFKRCEQGYIKLRFPISREARFISLKNIDSIPDILREYKDEKKLFGIATHAKGKRKKEDILEIPAVWVKYPGSYSEYDLKKLGEAELIPSIMVHSPSCIFYWLLNKPATVEENAKVKETLDLLAFELGSYPTSTNLRGPLGFPYTIG